MNSRKEILKRRLFAALFMNSKVLFLAVEPMHNFINIYREETEVGGIRDQRVFGKCNVFIDINSLVFECTIFRIFSAFKAVRIHCICVKITIL